MSKNEAAQQIPEQLTGIVTRIVYVLSGGQDAAIDIHNADTDSARLVLHWGTLHMTFTSAEQVQHLRGYFADARRSMTGSVNLATLPFREADPTEAATLVAVTWATTPRATLTPQQSHSERLRRTISCVDLGLGNLVFRILDKTALDSALEILGRAHALAVMAWPDGPQYGADPTRASWRPNEGLLKGRGLGYVPR
jgi:hypothetical protein